MRNIFPKFKINIATYVLILSFFLTGLIKNIIIIYFIILFHEMGHIMVARLLKYEVLKVEIYPSGGLTTLNKPINTKISHDIFIASAGILFQVFLFLLVFLVYQKGFLTNDSYNIFITYNKTILLFNILPIIPLDGYHLMRAFMEKFFSYTTSFYISIIISIIAIILFINYDQVFSLNNYLIISFLIFKIYQEVKEFKFKRIKFLLERFLNNISFNKIKYNKKINLNLLKKDTYHYFKDNKNIISEKKVLNRLFSYK